MEKRYIGKEKIIKLLKDLGHKEIELTYRKDEGWWLCSDKFDDWLAMNSYGCLLRINREFTKPAR